MFDAALVHEAIAAGAAFLPETRAVPGTVTGSVRQVRLIPTPPRPGTPGRGVGGEGAEILLARTPHPQPLSPEYRGEGGSGSSVTVNASLVLAADGLGGQFFAGAGDDLARPAEDSRIGAGVIADDAPAFYQAGCVFMACGVGGYVGLTRLEDGRLDVAAAFDREAVRQAGGPGEAAVEILGEVGLPGVPGLADRPWRGTPALTRRPTRVAAERILALGDAAGYVEPFTGEGIAWALASAVAVAPLASRPWEPDLGRAWTARHRQLVADCQLPCRLVAQVLRRPRLARFAIRLLSQWPGLAGPFVRRLNVVQGWHALRYSEGRA